MLRALTAEQLARAEYRLLHPEPGSRIEAAKKYGVDLTLLVEQLRLTPEERGRKLESASEALAKLRFAGLPASSEKAGGRNRPPHLLETDLLARPRTLSRRDKCHK